MSGCGVVNFPMDFKKKKNPMPHLIPNFYLLGERISVRTVFSFSSYCISMKNGKMSFA